MAQELSEVLCFHGRPVACLECAKEHRDSLESSAEDELPLEPLVDSALRATGFHLEGLTNSELYADFMTVARRAYALGHLHGVQSETRVLDAPARDLGSPFTAISNESLASALLKNARAENHADARALQVEIAYRLTACANKGA